MMQVYLYGKIIVKKLVGFCKKGYLCSTLIGKLSWILRI